MDKKDTKSDSAEPGSITLHELYRSLHDQLVLTIKKSRDLGKKSLAWRLDEVLFRQIFMEHDLHVVDVSLSNIEANYAIASSMIRNDLRDILSWLHAIDGNISESSDDIGEGNKRLSLLCKTNSRLCDKIETYDAIAANEVAGAVAYGHEAKRLRQLRRQLEEASERLHSGGKDTSQDLHQVLNAQDLTKDAALGEDQRRIDARMQAMDSSISSPIPTPLGFSRSEDQEQKRFPFKSNESDFAQNPLHHGRDQNTGEHGNSFDDPSRPQVPRPTTDDRLH